jgi:hypothetical protein
MRKKLNFLILSVLFFFILSFQGCLWYLTHDRSRVIVEGVDIDQTLAVAEHELRKGGWGSVLTVWALRDQYITPGQAEKINSLYFIYIDSLKRDFNIWHLTWAISNLYRLGNDNVKTVLESARQDASQRAKRLSRIADKFANGEQLYMGDAHIGGRAYAHRHLVVPGNRKYLQSVEEYLLKMK